MANCSSNSDTIFLTKLGVSNGSSLSVMSALSP